MPPLMVIAQLRLDAQVAPTHAALPEAPVQRRRHHRRLRHHARGGT